MPSCRKIQPSLLHCLIRVHALWMQTAEQWHAVLPLWQCMMRFVAQTMLTRWRWSLQLEKYHEQAQLLDPHVTTIVERLTAVIRREALRGSQTNERTVQQAAEFLWALVTVRCTS